MHPTSRTQAIAQAQQHDRIVAARSVRTTRKLAGRVPGKRRLARPLRASTRWLRA